MREIRSSGSEGGVADSGHPYPYKKEAGLSPGLRVTDESLSLLP
jgi:hypothetical protein